MSNKTNSLEKRIKENYENRAKTYLVRRSPVVIRCDGRSFHTFTQDFERPYDEIFHKAMNETTKYLCQNIQGCKIGYTQSDEITLILTDYDTLTTDAWFGYAVQKMCSIAASMATLAFNKAFEREVNFGSVCRGEYNIKYEKAIRKGAMFDARCFNVPKEEIANVLIWRQQDATRNAIQMLGQCHFSHDELKKKNNDQVQDMLFLQKGINFNDMPTKFKRGVCCVKNENGKWFIDKEIPIFTKDRNYIEKHFVFEEKENN